MVVKRENGDGVYWAVGEFEAERARKSWKSWTLNWYFFCILDVFRRQTWIVPFVDKTPHVVLQAYKLLGVTFDSLHHDAGVVFWAISKNTARRRALLKL